MAELDFFYIHVFHSFERYICRIHFKNVFFDFGKTNFFFFFFPSVFFSFLFFLTKYIWSRPDLLIPMNQRPPRRTLHSTTTLRDHTNHNLERLIVYGGWNGSNVLNDVWSYSPSATFGSKGKFNQKIKTKTKNKINFQKNNNF